MVKGSLWGSAWVENVRNPNIEQQNSSLWSLGCWLLGWKSSAIFSASLLGMPHSSLHLAHSWFHHASQASFHPQSKGSKMKGHPTINFPKTSIKGLAKKLYVYISHSKRRWYPQQVYEKCPSCWRFAARNPPLRLMSMGGRRPTGEGRSPVLSDWHSRWICVSALYMKMEYHIYQPASDRIGVWETYTSNQSAPLASMSAMGLRFGFLKKKQL